MKKLILISLLLTIMLNTQKNIYAMKRSHHTKENLPQQKRQETDILKNHEIISNLNDPNDIFELGVRYETGNGVEKNLEMAIELYKKAAKQGYIRAIYKLEICYHIVKMNKAI